jgi:MinD superfamily P-loop ATPase
MGAEKPQFVGGCNCCGCCCGVLHSQKLSGISEAAQRSNYRAVIDPEKCISCGACIERCPVDAIAEDENGKSKVDRAKCIGCGVCVIKCPTDAIELEPVSAQEWFHTPSSMAEWEERRLEYLASQK